MVTDLKTILEIGEKRGCAIPAFNVYNMESVMGVLDAARETGAPVIFQMYSRLFDHPNAQFAAPVIHEAMRQLETPAVFHLDHGAGIPEVVRALRLGAGGIMMDASAFPLEENIEKTRDAVRLCAECGVPVEGELGHVGTTKDEQMGEYTDVAEAERFVRETGVAALAIMVGTAHGRYKQTPVLDIQRIRDIREETGIPVVLHGGSGVPDDQMRMAIEAGVRKVNFGTDLCYAFLDSVVKVDRGIVALDMFMREPIRAVKEFAVNKIRLLGADTI
jgi:fructose-bisphosphate aldolase class II